MMPGAMINLLGVWLKGTMTRSDLAGIFQFTALACLLLLPFFTTLFRIRSADRPRQQVFRMVVWGLAAGVGLFLGLQSIPKLDLRLWGVWLYLGIALIGVLLELLVWVGGRKPKQGE